MSDKLDIANTLPESRQASNDALQTIWQYFDAISLFFRSACCIGPFRGDTDLDVAIFQ